MNGTDYMHLASLEDKDWHLVCMCDSLSPKPYGDCCNCTDRHCSLLLHSWYIDGYDQYWPYYTYYKHGEDVLKFYYTKNRGPSDLPLGSILSDWVSKLHSMEAACTTV